MWRYPTVVTFTPGNQLAKRRRPPGAQREAAKARTLLALQLREDPRMAKLIDHLWQHAFGVNPVTGEPVDDRGQREAARMILERAYGTPPQHVHVEEQLRLAMMIMHADTSVARPQLTLEEINRRRAVLQAAGITPRTIDVEEQPQLVESVTPTGDDD